MYIAYTIHIGSQKGVLQKGAFGRVRERNAKLARWICE